MDTTLLKKHIHNFINHSKSNQIKASQDLKDRALHVSYYKGFTHEKILSMSEESIYEYISKLWAMLIWGNKRYVVDKLIKDNGLGGLRQHLAAFVWGKDTISTRWDFFRKNVKGMGPAMMSEILCKTHPNDFMLWNRRAYVGLNYLKIEELPRYDYQLTGDVYSHLCDVCKNIADQLEQEGCADKTLLAVDYFIWDELQVEENLNSIHTKKSCHDKNSEKPDDNQSEFIHNDIRDKLRDIGQWLGFESKIEQKVSEGSKVDTIWEATIGNLGRVIYIFEVQTKGSIDSLIINLLKSLNNPAVQGVVAVSDKAQLERIKRHALDPTFR